MLAVHQQPQAMASGRRPDTDDALPFGYFVEESFLQNAPNPPPGAPLLSDHEQKTLDSWFEEMTSDNAMLANPPSGLMHSDLWIDMPPHFVGSSSSFGLNPDPRRDVLSQQDLSQNLFAGMPLIPLSPAVHHQPPQPLPSTTQPLSAVPAGPSVSRSNSTPAVPATLATGFAHHTPPGTNPLTARFGIHPSVDMQPSAEVLEAATLLQNGSLGLRARSFHFESRPSFAQPPPPPPPQQQQNHQQQPQQQQQQQQPMHRPQRNSNSAAAGRPRIPETPQPLAASALPPSTLMASAVGPAQAHISSVGSIETVRPAGLMFSPDGSAPPPPTTLGSSLGRGAGRRQGLSWGSDKSFAQKQFTPQSEKETSEALVSQRFKSMECLEVSRSADTTRPPTPTNESAAAAANGYVPLHLKTRTVSFLGETEANGRPDLAPPRKRRKSKGVKSEDGDLALGNENAVFSGSSGYGGPGFGDDDILDGAASTGGAAKPRKRKSVSVPNGHAHPHLASHASQSPVSPPHLLLGSATKSPASVDGGSADGSGGGGGSSGKRRRSTGVAKPPRENLTEEQKRENHIKSEQKRRTLIKSGFEDLCRLVPGLQGGSVSKSVMLSMAADWLEDMLLGNRRLKEQLQQM